MMLAGEMVLVTGGTGFLGGRLVEKLVLECKAKVRVLVHDFSHAARIARFPLEMIHGDVTDGQAVRRAIDGCQVVFHCSYGNKGSAEEQKAVTVGGTEEVAKAALAAGVSRMLHVSTVSVYGRARDGDLDETMPRQQSGDLYADTKLRAEQLIFEYHRKHSLPVTVVQPTIIYGPSARVWTIWPISQLKTGRVVLVNGGDGLCNAVYVDDVVDAMILAATSDRAVGEAFLVSGERPVTWREFYAAYEQMLGVQSTVAMSVGEIRLQMTKQERPKSTAGQVLRVLRENTYIRTRLIELPAVGKPYRFFRSVLPEPVWNNLRHRILGYNVDRNCTVLEEGMRVHIPSDTLCALFGAKTRVRIDKAKEYLKYKPRFDFEHGMHWTAKWAIWANIL